MIYLVQHTNTPVTEVKRIKGKLPVSTLTTINPGESQDQFADWLIHLLKTSPTERVIIDLLPEENGEELAKNLIQVIEKDKWVQLNKPTFHVLCRGGAVTPEKYNSFFIYTSYDELTKDLLLTVSCDEGIEWWLQTRLPLLPVGEAFYVMLLFRRKWLLSNYYLEKAKEFFPSDQVKIGECLLYYPTINWYAKVESVLSSLRSGSCYKIIKGKVFNFSEIYYQYCNAFSLVITFEPRNVIKGIKEYSFQTLKRLIDEPNPEDCPALMKPDKEILSQIHKKRSRGRKFVLVDFDLDSNAYLTKEDQEKVPEVREKYLSALKAYLTDELAILKNLKYVCSTPSYGFHMIFELSHNVQEVMFKRRAQVLSEMRKLAKEFKFPLKEIEFKTGQCLTHIPYFNPLIKDYTNWFV